MKMKKWMLAISAALLSGSACDLERDYGSCGSSRRECAVQYSPSAGYGRSCRTAYGSCYEAAQRVEPNQSQSAPVPSAEDAGGNGRSLEPPASTPPKVDQGAAALPGQQRYSAFDFPCERDSQCGPGKCLEGACYYGCQADSQCGSGDRCAVESGTRICRPDPNPPVTCTRSAQCTEQAVCLNGSCRQTCVETEECSNLLDRCAAGICQPDRRPLGQCVLNSECGAGNVCLDGSCVAACANAADGGMCLADPSTIGTGASTEAPPATTGSNSESTVVPGPGGNGPATTEVDPTTLGSEPESAPAPEGGAQPDTAGAPDPEVDTPLDAGAPPLP